MVTAMSMLVGITGAVYGPAINRALKRDANNPEAYDTAATMLPTGFQTKQKTPVAHNRQYGRCHTVKDLTLNRIQPAFTTRS